MIRVRSVASREKKMILVLSWIREGLLSWEIVFKSMREAATSCSLSRSEKWRSIFLLLSPYFYWCKFLSYLSLKASFYMIDDVTCRFIDYPSPTHPLS